MITAIYKGKKPQRIRAGLVKKNTRVQLTEEEAFTVRQDPEWQLIRTAPPPGTPENLRPVRGVHFDLTSLPWTNGKAVFAAATRMGRPVLVKALSQLEACGVPVPPITNRDDAGDLRERFLELTRQLGWF